MLIKIDKYWINPNRVNYIEDAKVPDGSPTCFVNFGMSGSEEHGFIDDSIGIDLPAAKVAKLLNDNINLGEDNDG